MVAEMINAIKGRESRKNKIIKTSSKKLRDDEQDKRYKK